MSMKDSLKEFMDANRDGFDNKQPNQTAWTKIEAGLSSHRTRWWNMVSVWRAAAIILFGLSSYLLITRTAPINKTNRQLASEFKDLDAFYSNQITEKAELVSQFQIEQGETDDEVTQNIQKLEAMYQVLKTEMRQRPSQDVKDALVLNLLVRIDLLNQHLNKLDRREEDKESSKSV